ncbi:DNA/RNA non-specific endonuclease [Cytophagaceae bacterium DM2B3-1]|uniref:Endonuclease n=1 Tax=Xanthocytophaga flava TaxID=3048013 RepID=A0ABT7D009_9BACT|nr:DNA/RNA non-specific endonuclease [Xanthocytophaga flavus]MDJ1498502.1 DNA/RNA non-specific endonuclease [Xanthocytophaga flavus]
MAKSNTSNALFWAIILVGIFVLIGNWKDFFGKGTFGGVSFPKEEKKSTSKKGSKDKNTPSEEEEDEDDNEVAEPATGADFEKRADFVYPTGQKVEVVKHSAYALGYSEKYEQPAWVSYRLTSSMVTGNNKREDNFRPDPDVSTGSAVPEDYRGSGYDRGHLAPVADFRASAKWMDETFFMSNMSPQLHEFNAGIWEKLESKARGWARHNKVIYITSGPILKSGLPTIGRYNKVAIPEYYYKVIYDIREPEVKAIGFMFRNEGTKKPLQSFAMSVDEVERRTGLDFFPQLPDELEKKLEGSFNASQWFDKSKKDR